MDRVSRPDPDYRHPAGQQRYAHQGRIKKAWNLAAQSCKKAEALKAKYEHAKSLLVQGQLAKKLSRPEAEDQIQTAQTEIARIEKAIDDLIR